MANTSIGSNKKRGARCGWIAVFLAVLAWSSSAQAWWNNEWSLRKKITIDTGVTGAAISDPIGVAAPILLRLHSGNFRFGAAKEDGGDIRFVAGDDKTPLKYHVERFNSLLGEALIWVNVPDIKPGAKTEIWLYYGNKKAVATSDPKGTYDADTTLIYHFADRGIPPQDSSVWANHAQNIVPTADGALIGQGLRFDGTGALALPITPSLGIAENSQQSWSVWFNMAAPQPNAPLLYREDANAFLIGLDNGVPFVQVINAGNVQRSAPAAAVSPGWHHIAAVADGSEIVLYIDGDRYTALAASLPALSGPAYIGGKTVAPNGDAPAADNATPAMPDAASPADAAPAVAQGFIGDIDELAVSKTARPAGFIKFAAISQGRDPGKLIAYTTDEETSSWLSGYFAVILKSVTLDGWVVIGLLGIMAVVSWVVMIDKVTYLNRQSRANAQFMKRFRANAGDLTLLDHGEGDDAEDLDDTVSKADKTMMAHSSLYRIYHVGAEEIRHRFARSNGNAVLSAQALAVIKAGLDSCYLKETQKLNRLIVVLTIAISGGPFLGLLGTVVGVMITFAAIAATGDVNVNAIAPGIAAALVATVAGLGVAIPALFGYNYLISRMSDLTSDMQVFIDEFITRLAEAYQPGNSLPNAIAAE
jgi:biopolymer transport protein ExbB